MEQKSKYDIEIENFRHVFYDMKNKKIAIYGMGNVGEHLYNVLKNTDIKVMYGIDSKAVDTDYEIKVYSPDYELPNVDAIVVTIPFAFTSIKDSLEQKTANEIVSLEHILFEV